MPRRVTKPKPLTLTPAQAKLFNDNLGLAYSAVKRFVASSKSDPDELRAASLVGLARAAQVFNPKRAQFSTIAFWCCRNEMMRVIRADQRYASKNGELCEESLTGGDDDSTEERELIGKAVGLLSRLRPLERELLELRFGLSDEKLEQVARMRGKPRLGRAMTLREIAHHFKMTHQGANGVEQRALRKLREMM